jgi:hypothetical protein
MVLSDRLGRLAFCANGSQASDPTAFLRALFLAGDHAFGLDSHDIESVEAAWSISDTIASSHRWVVALADESMSSTSSTTAAAGSPRSSRRRISDRGRPILSLGTIPGSSDTALTLNRPLGLTPPSLH